MWLKLLWIVAFYNDVKWAENGRITDKFPLIKLKLSSALRKQNLRVIMYSFLSFGFNLPLPQFQSVWRISNSETYRQPLNHASESYAPVCSGLSSISNFTWCRISLDISCLFIINDVTAVACWGTKELRYFSIIVINHRWSWSKSWSLPSECSVHEATSSSEIPTKEICE